MAGVNKIHKLNCCHSNGFDTMAGQLKTGVQNEKRDQKSLFLFNLNYN